jgi:hypothetical protein
MNERKKEFYFCSAFEHWEPCELFTELSAHASARVQPLSCVEFRLGDTRGGEKC